MGEYHPITLVDLAGLGACYRATHRLADAHRVLAASIASFPATAGLESDKQPIEFVLCEFGLTLVQEARFAEAESTLRDALAHYDSTPPNPLGLRLRPRQRAVMGLGQALAGQGKFAEAEPMVVQAFDELSANKQRIAGDRSGIAREACEAVLAVYTAWGKPEKIVEWQTKLSELANGNP
jgi:tetratricopeptide (TPR) repeat protein